jgi:UDP-xylose/UDP-N-acetylglucosamine transporter B4
MAQHPVWGVVFPALKQRQAPISHWAAQVFLLTAGSLLNNWVYAFHVPLTVQIVFRSAGTPQKVSTRTFMN